ncbi:Gx transporter family protein [Thiobacillus denitrificans]|uniref:Heptaprenyl diphosphate synthase n=1 Tax=Thiobacillus denitrificans TaxID=36861 RepID=A0A106BR91_THIDE|nr:Gx transporter family protein [Thiobacillus denitrificans]KVW97164.1 heptaprenyl diphosphate synthase [Thiobacillus denitrificans]
MTRSAIELPVTADDRRIARLAALAIGLTLAEAAIPSPIPGVKPGLANIVILLVLLQYGWRAAAWVSVLRLLAGGLLLGSLFAPGFWLAAAGALVSLSVLGLARHLPDRYFGPVSLSVLAAFGHIGGQLALAGIWLLPAAALLKLLPVFAAAALIFGAVNGVIVARLLAGPVSSGRQSGSCTPPSIP